jgi:hypothetical protein
MQHLERNNQAPSCFLNRNSRDFDDPDVLGALEQRNCRMLSRFSSGLSYIVHQL